MRIKDTTDVNAYAAMEAAETGEGIYRPFDTVDDLMEVLNA